VAGREVGKDAERLNALILNYQKPLRIFLLGQFRAFPEITKNADELLQGFATDKILSEGWLKKANRQKGRFRNFLRTSLKNYVLDWSKKARLPTIPLGELEDQGIEPVAPETPSNDFDLSWTQSVLAETLEKMENDCKAPSRDQPRRSQIWELFRLRLLDPIFKQTKPVPYGKLVEGLGLKSPSEGTNMLLTAKRMFKRHLNDTIAEYEGSEKAAESELVALAERISQLAEQA